MRAPYVPVSEQVHAALEQRLAWRRRQRLAKDIRAYAVAVAGTEEDLDPELEKAGLESPLR